MTDDRQKSSGGQESVARTTARDVPFMRGDSDLEPAPRGQRPAQLPRDPTYEQELAQVELAVLRNPERRDDPSTKQAGRRGFDQGGHEVPESVTPESPGARAHREASLVRSPTPPSSGGRAVASGTLLSVGSVDPRGKTERTLETPRMFFSRSEQAEAYFKPGAIPAVTVHQTLETETVKLSDSIDPRRAKTIPRLDRAALARLAELENVPESAAPLALSNPSSSLDLPASAASMRWNQQEYEADPASYSPNDDGQIHASLSLFREQVESDLDFDGVPTRAEPLAARRSELPPPASLPDPSVVPTQRDLPMHRIEASRPPPPPVAAEPLSAPRASAETVVPMSDGPSPTTASIAAEAPEPRPAWVNYIAFLLALLAAVIVGLWLTRQSPTPSDTPKIDAKPRLAERAPLDVVAPQAAPRGENTPVESVKEPRIVERAPPAPSAKRAPAPAGRDAAAADKALTPPAPAASPRKPSPPKTPREPIF